MRPFIAALIGGPALCCMQSCTGLGQQEEARVEAALVNLRHAVNHLTDKPFPSKPFWFLINLFFIM